MLATIKGPARADESVTAGASGAVPRVEHYNSAEHHGVAAARTMLGSATPFDYIHDFWSDQYEHTDLWSLAR